MILLLAMALTVPTFNKEVAPILFARCAGCHRPDNIAPMSLLDYKSARPWAKGIKASVAARKMPPWFADPRFGHFSNDARLSDAELKTIAAWVDGGAPEGDANDLPPAPKFVEGWALGKPDAVIDIGEDHQIAPGDDVYEKFVVPTNFAEGRWVRAAEIKPGNRQVVHHVHVHVLAAQDNPAAKPAAPKRKMATLSEYLLKEGKLTRIMKDAPVWNDGCADKVPELPFLTGAQEGGLAAFLPGRAPDQFPEGTAKWVPAGAKLEFQIHYAQVKGKPQTDRTSVGFHFLNGPPRQALRRMDLRNFFMQIPAGEANHEVRRCYDFESDRYLISFTPHMHYRGKDAKYELVRPNGQSETLLAVPHYDFNWQLVYRLQKPMFVEKGSRLMVTVHYDNSRNNKANPDPQATVRWGDKTEEEMMTSWIEYLDASPSAQLQPSEAARAR